MTFVTLTNLWTFAQNAQYGTVVYNQSSKPCVYSDYNMPADMVQGALRKKLSDSKMPSESKAADGFKLLKSAMFAPISQKKLDYYYRIDDKKSMTTLYLMPSLGNENFMDKETYGTEIENAMRFLNEFTVDIQAFKLTKDIEKQESIIKDADKKTRSLAKEGESLLSSKSKTESRIAKNKMQQSAMQSQVENQQKLVDAARARTGTIDEMKSLQKEVDKQESALKKATKNYNNAVRDGESLQKDLSKNERDIESNKQTQQLHMEEIKKQRDLLQSLRTELNGLIRK